MHTERHTTVPDLLVILLRHGDYMGDGTTKKIRPVAVTEDSLFYCNRDTGCSTRIRTHIYILPAALIMPDDSREQRFLFSLSSRVTKIQSQACIAWLHGRTKLNGEMRRATTESNSVGLPISSLPRDPRTLPTHAAHLQQRLLSGGPKEGICSEQNGRWLADADLYKKIIWVLNKTLVYQGSLFPGSNLERIASLQSFKACLCERWSVVHSKYSRNTQLYTGEHTKCLIKFYNIFLIFSFRQLRHVAFFNSWLIF
jgi:hypothetical protein